MDREFKIIRNNDILKKEKIKQEYNSKREQLKKVYENIIFDNDMCSLNLYNKDIKTVVLIGIKYYAKFGAEILKKFKEEYKIDRDKTKYKRKIDMVTNNAILLDMCCASLTILTFENLFPISKIYDGDRYQMKDYFYTLEYIDKLGIDKDKEIIGLDKIDEFFMEYTNRDIVSYNIFKMLLLNDLQVLNGEETIFEKFVKENGISTLKKVEKGIFFDSRNKQIYKEVKNDIDYSGRRHLKLVEKNKDNN